MLLLVLSYRQVLLSTEEGCLVGWVCRAGQRSVKRSISHKYLFFSDGLFTEVCMYRVKTEDRRGLFGGGECAGGHVPLHYGTVLGGRLDCTNVLSGLEQAP